MPPIETYRTVSAADIESREGSTRTGISFGTYIPDTVLTNEMIESWNIRKGNGEYLTADGIKNLLGIERRFIARNKSVMSMGFLASKAALGDERNIDAVIVSTSYPVGMNVSQTIANGLGLHPSYHTDIHAACSGFVRGLNEMHDQTQKAMAGDTQAVDFRGKRVLFVASEKYSDTVVNLQTEGYEGDNDLNQTIFSDGAVAMVFTYGEDLEVIDCQNFKFPSQYDNYIRMPIDATISVAPCIIEPVPVSETGKFIQRGKGVYKEVLKAIPAFFSNLVKGRNDVKAVFLHQGSGKMIDALASSDRLKGFNVPKDMINGNFSSASAPMALMHAFEDGTVEPGDTVVLVQFGAGLYASGAVVKFKTKQLMEIRY